MPTLPHLYLHQPQVLVHVPPHRQVVYAYVLHHLRLVHDERPPETDARVGQNAVGFGDLLFGVGEERDVNVAESPVGSRFLGVFHVAEVWIDGAADDFAAHFPEELGLVRELDDLGGADEGEVEGVEEQQHVLVLEVVEGEFLEGLLGAVPGLGLEERGNLADCRSDRCCCHIWY